MSKEEVSYRCRVVATLMKGQSKEVIFKRRFAYFDTAMPRMVQLCLNYGNEGDIVEFYSHELGFQIGILRILKNNRYEVDMSPLIKSSPTLLKLINA